MNQVLIVESNLKLLNLLTQIIDAYDFEYHTASNEQQALDLLNLHQFTIIILGLTLSDHKIKLLQHIKRHLNTIPIVILQTDKNQELDIDLKSVSENLTILHRPQEIRQLPKILLNIITEEPNNFHPFATALFFSLTEAPVDIYIKITENKFIKFIHAQESLTEDHFTSIKKKKLTNIYVLTQDRRIFLDAYIKEATSELLNSTREQKFNTANLNKVCQLVYTDMDGLNMEPLLVQSGQNLVSNALNQLKQSAEVEETLNQILTTKQLPYNRSIATAFLASAICKESPWASEANRQKVVIAGLMHDLSLKKIPQKELIYASKTNIQQSNIPEKIKSFLLKHPILSANLIRKQGCSKPDVFKIIEQHHEAPDGSGYPKGLRASNIFPLATILIVAEHFINEFYSDIDNCNTKAIYNKIAPIYREGNFIKVLASLKKILKV